MAIKAVRKEVAKLEEEGMKAQVVSRGANGETNEISISMIHPHVKILSMCEINWNVREISSASVSSLCTPRCLGVNKR